MFHIGKKMKNKNQIPCKTVHLALYGACIYLT